MMINNLTCTNLIFDKVHYFERNKYIKNAMSIVRKEIIYLFFKSAISISLPM